MNRLRSGLRPVAVGACCAFLSVPGAVFLAGGDGLRGSDLHANRTTMWLLHRPSGTLVLADALTGGIVARLDTDAAGDRLEIDQGAAGVFVLNRTTSQLIEVDEGEMRLKGPATLPTAVPSTSDVSWAVSSTGVTIADNSTGTITEVPTDGEIRVINAGSNGATLIVDQRATVWRQTGDDVQAVGGQPANTEPPRLEDGGRLSSDSRRWTLPADRRWTAVDLVADSRQECIWVAGGDDLACIATSDGSPMKRVAVPGFAVGEGDRLAVHSGIAVAVSPAGEVRAAHLDRGVLDLVEQFGSSVRIEVDQSTLWVDQLDGRRAIATSDFGVRLIDKLSSTAPEFGPDGIPRRGGQGRGDTTDGDVDEVSADADDPFEPDDDGVDDPPVATDDQASGRADSADGIAVDVLSNDYDPDGGPIAVSAVSAPQRGTAVAVQGRSVLYRPEEGFSGVDRFDYSVVDSAGHVASATVVIDIVAFDSPNTAPVGRDDRFDGSVGRPLLLDVLANDHDADSDPLRIASVVNVDTSLITIDRMTAANGRPMLRLNALDPAAGRTVEFDYIPVDALGASGAATHVQVAIAAPDLQNRPPIARNDSARSVRGRPTSIAVLGNDTDPDGDSLRVVGATPVNPSDGLFVSFDATTVTMSSAATDVDTVTLRYTVEDARGAQAVASVLVTVDAPGVTNSPPIAVRDTGSSTGEAVSIDVLANDTDPDGDAMAIIRLGTTDSGTVTVIGASTVRFVPTAQAEGVATFSYTVGDGRGGEATSIVAIEVRRAPPLAVPLAVDDSAATVVDQPVVIDVLSNDSDPNGGGLSIAGQPLITLGTVAVRTDQRLVFTPPPGQIGTIRFQYRVRSSAGLEAQATVVVDVRAPVLTNRPPIAVPDNALVQSGASVTIDVVANDRDPDAGDSVQLIRVVAPVVGRATVVAGRVRFDAPQSFEGLVQFRYEIADRDGVVASAAVVVSVLPPVRQAPVTSPDLRTAVAGTVVDVDVLANDIDPDGTGTSMTVLGAQLDNPAPVAINVARTGVVSFNPRAGFVGTVTATYSIRDSDGLTAPGTITVEWTAPANRPPVAADDRSTTAAGVPIELNVLSNDADPDGGALQVGTVAVRDGGGTVTVLADRATLRYTPAAGFVGRATVTYTASDGVNESSPAAWEIVVLQCAAGPIAAADRNEFTPYGTPLPIGLDLPAGVNVGVTQPPHGAVAVEGSVVTFTPTPGTNATGSFRYTLSDECGATASGTITVDVNRAPRALPVSFTVPAGELINLAAGSFAIDDEPLRIIAVDGDNVVASNTATDGSSVRVEFGDPPSGQTTQSTTLQVTLADPGGLEVESIALVTVVGDAPPRAVDDVAVVDPSGSTTIDFLQNDILYRPSPPEVVAQVRSGQVTSLLLENIAGRDQLVVVVDPATTEPVILSYQLIDDRGLGSNVAIITVRPLVQPPPTTTTTTTTPPTTTTPATTPATTTTIPPTTSAPSGPPTTTG